jgi:hypothetical protein
VADERRTAIKCKKDRLGDQCHCQMLTRRLDMPIGKRICWLLVGAVIGAIAVSTLAAAQLPAERPQRRLTFLRTAGPIEFGNAYFIKDAKTGACWLSVTFHNDTGGTLAPAPTPSCEQ